MSLYQPTICTVCGYNKRLWIVHFMEPVLYDKLNPIHTLTHYLYVTFFSHLHPQLIRCLLITGFQTKHFTYLNVMSEQVCVPPKWLPFKLLVLQITLSFLNVFSESRKGNITFVIYVCLCLFSVCLSVCLSFCLPVRLSFRPSVFPNRKICLPLDGFSWNLILQDF